MISYIGISLVIIFLFVGRKLKFKVAKILIMGFLIGAFVIPPIIFPYLFMVVDEVFGGKKIITPISFLFSPGYYSSSLFYQEQPTLDALFKPGTSLSELGEGNQKLIAEHPTVPVSTALSEIIGKITNGIYYAIIFWLVYLIFRKKQRINNENL